MCVKSRLGILTLVIAVGVSALTVAAKDALPPRISDQERSKWSAVGRVNIHGFKSRTLCTGVLIAPDQVLTAAHCVLDPRSGAPFALYRVNFVAGWHKGDFAAHGKARQVVVDPRFKPGGKMNMRQAAADIAIILLKDPIAVPDLPPARVSDSGEARAPIALVGYRFDRPHVLTRYQDCTPQPQGTVLLLACKATFGTSGAPVFTRSAQGWDIVGVISGIGGGRSIAAPVNRTRIEKLLEH